MDRQLIWTDCNEAAYYVVPNVLSPRDLVSRPDNMDKTVPHTVVSSDVFARIGQSIACLGLCSGVHRFDSWVQHLSLVVSYW